MNKITIVKRRDRYEAQFAWDVETKDFVKALGFRFDPAWKVWWTISSEVAAKADRSDAALVAQVNADREARHERQAAAIVASHATDAAIELPLSDYCRARGWTYKGYQRAGIAYALPRKDTLIGDEMGLGKTIQAVGIINADRSIRKVLVVCPAGLKLNWKKELSRWLARPMSVGLANGGAFPDTDIVIVNYDVLKKFDAEIKARTWDLFVADEAHMAKNKKAQRTQALFGKWDNETKSWAVEPLKAGRRLFLTGTPILNRPKELWTIVHALDPKGLGANWKFFHQRYCAGHINRHGYWDVSGASNLAELNTKLRSAFMVRRLKSEVLPELEPKRKQVIVLEPSAKARRLIERQNALEEAIRKARGGLVASEASEDPKAIEAAVAALTDASDASFEEMSALRREIALEKLPQVIDHVRSALDEGEDKLIVFAHHRDVVEALHREFADVGAVKLMGGDSPQAKVAAEERFQTDQSCKVFVGSIKAAGLGLTLTAAQTVIMAEQDWTPGWNDQAEDRAHRIGQEGSLLVQYIVLDGSLDAKIAQTNVEKADVADAALDSPGAALAPVKKLIAPPPHPANIESAMLYGKTQTMGVVHDVPAPENRLGDVADLPEGW